MNKKEFDVVSTDSQINNLNGWSKYQEDILKDWAEKAICYKWLNEMSYKHYKSRNMIFAIPIIIISTLSGTANFGMESIFVGPVKQYGNVIIGSMSLVVGVISTLSNFFRFAEYSESHRVSSINWSKFQRLLATELAMDPVHRTIANDFLQSSRAELDRLIEQQPTFPNQIVALFKSKFRHVKIEQPVECDNIQPVKVFGGFIDALKSIKDGPNYDEETARMEAEMNSIQGANINIKANQTVNGMMTNAINNQIGMINNSANTMAANLANNINNQLNQPTNQLNQQTNIPQSGSSNQTLNIDEIRKMIEERVNQEIGNISDEIIAKSTGFTPINAPPATKKETPTNMTEIKNNFRDIKSVYEKNGVDTVETKMASALKKQIRARSNSVLDNSEENADAIAKANREKIKNEISSILVNSNAKKMISKFETTSNADSNATLTKNKPMSDLKSRILTKMVQADKKSNSGNIELDDLKKISNDSVVIDIADNK